MRAPALMPALLGAVAAGAAACAACAGVVGGGRSADPARFAGCYALALGRWTAGALAAGGAAPVALPPVVRLLPDPEPDAGRGHYAIRPTLGAGSGRADFPPSWAVDGGRNVVAEWAARDGTYRMLLAPARGDTLRGTATYTRAGGLAGQFPRRAAVTAVRGACPAELR